MESKGDIRLMERARQGDSAAFERLVEDNYMLIYRTAYKFTDAREEAEDVAQEVCIKLARAVRGFRGGSSFKTWLYRVVVNAARDYIRKHATKRRHEEEFVREQHITGNPGGTEGVSGNPGVTPESLLVAINRMPEKYRDALLLVHSEGLSHKDAGEVLGCAESTVSWRVHEGKKKLKEMLKRNGHG